MSGIFEVKNTIICRVRLSQLALNKSKVFFITTHKLEIDHWIQLKHNTHICLILNNASSKNYFLSPPPPPPPPSFFGNPSYSVYTASQGKDNEDEGQ